MQWCLRLSASSPIHFQGVFCLLQSFEQHLESIPPAVIRNSSTEVLMVKYTPAYELEEFHVLQADAEHTVHTAFPLYVSLEALATEHAETLRGGQSCEYNGQDFVTQ